MAPTKPPIVSPGSCTTAADPVPGRASPHLRAAMVMATGRVRTARVTLSDAHQRRAVAEGDRVAGADPRCPVLRGRPASGLRSTRQPGPLGLPDRGELPEQLGDDGGSCRVDQSRLGQPHDLGTLLALVVQNRLAVRTEFPAGPMLALTGLACFFVVAGAKV